MPASGTLIAHKAPFIFNTPGLLTGAVLEFTDGYTPATGDLLIDAHLEIDTAWDGTTPLGDFGSFVGFKGGFFSSFTGHPIDMTQADSNAVDTQYLTGSANSQPPMNDAVALSTFNQASARLTPMRFLSGEPIKFVVSQDGSNVGDDPGSTQGAGILYVVTARF